LADPQPTERGHDHGTVVMCHATARDV
jgi:hypothetical protein